MDPITGLALGRIAVGSVSFVSPSLAGKLFLLDPEANPQLAYLSRLFGSREIALGALTLASKGTARRRLVQVGVAIDSSDVFTGIASAATGAVSKKAGVLLALFGAGAVASGVASLQGS